MTSAHDEPAVLTLTEAAQYLRVTTKKVRALAEDRFPALLASLPPPAAGA